MAKLLALPLSRVLDANGNVYPGALLYAYLTGTTTPTSVYTTSALSVAHANPIVADAGGFLPAIFLDPAVVYRFKAKTAAGADITGMDFDPVSVTSTGDIQFTDTGSGATATTVQSLLRSEYINAKAFGATGDGTTNDTTACQNAINAAIAQNRALYFPPGTYKTGALSINPTANLAYATSFRAGIHIIGSGQGRTIFDMIGTSAPLFDVYTGASLKFILGGVLEGFTIRSSTSASGCAGIRLTNAYQVELSDIHIIGMSDYGVRIRCEAGDSDASNMLRLSRVRIETCLGWGIDSAADSGFNEISNLVLEQVFVQACGTNVVGTPTSGGMKWKGQELTIVESGFVICENVGLYIPGQSGIANSCNLTEVVFENNKKRGLYVTGIHGLKGRSLQFYNNDSYTATNQCEFDGTSNVVRAVDIDGVVVRATAGNSGLTAFKFGGANAALDTMRINPDNVVWENFDHAGSSQVRYDGVRFARVEKLCIITDSGAATSVLLKAMDGGGNTMPLRLRGPKNQTGSGDASTSGEWTTLRLVSPLVLASAGLTPDTTYNVYLYDNANVPALEASATAYVTDSATGYFVKDGDATKLFVGRVRTSSAGGGEFLRADIGWVNPAPYPGSISGANGWTWRDTASTPDRIYFKDSATLPTSASDGQYVALT